MTEKRGEVTVTVKYPDSFPQKSALAAWKMYVQTVLEKAKVAGVDGTIIVIGTADLRDEYGEVSKDEQVASAMYWAETVKKMNLDNLNYDQVWDVADEWMLHPAVRP